MLYHPVRIGSLSLAGNLFLAPVAGYSDRAFRSICADCGADFAYTEMVSAEALTRGSGKTEALMRRAPNERAYAVQLFGGNPDVMARAARLVLERTSAECIDINCGCPVPKIVKTGAGSALTREPEKLYAVVKAVVDAVSGYDGERPVHSGATIAPNARSENGGTATATRANGDSGAFFTNGAGDAQTAGAIIDTHSADKSVAATTRACNADAHACNAHNSIIAAPTACVAPDAHRADKSATAAASARHAGADTVNAGAVRNGTSVTAPAGIAGTRAAVPVTVKIRSGWDSEHITWKEAALAALEAGAAAITLHARTRAQGYEGKADWNLLAELVQLVGGRVPVFGSGDAFTPQDAARMLGQTGCDGVMFARGAMGNPFLFTQAHEFLQTGAVPDIPASDRIRAGFRELELLIDDRGEQSACMEMRKRFCAYSRGIAGGSALRKQIVAASTQADFKAAFAAYL